MIDDVFRPLVEKKLLASITNCFQITNYNKGKSAVAEHKVSAEAGRFRMLLFFS